MKLRLSENLKYKIPYTIIMILLLGTSYLISRFVLFQMHGMKQWPNFLALLSIIVIIVASLVGKRIIPAATVIGYIGGFILAMTFNTDGVDPGGGRTNNAWIIWTVVLFICLLVALILEIFFKKAHKKASSISIIRGADGPTDDKR